MKRLMTAGAMSLALIAGSAQANEVVLDASSQETLNQSAQEAMSTVSPEEQSEFMTSVDVLSVHQAQAALEENHGVESAGPEHFGKLSSAENQQVMESTFAELDGRTIEQVIETASAPDLEDARMVVAMISQQRQAAQEQATEQGQY